MVSDRARVLGVAVHRLTLDQTVQRCADLIELRQCATHLSVNAAKIVAIRRDPRMGRFAACSTLVSADGQSVVWASRLLGDPLPERVAGIDLMRRLVAVAEDRGYGVFVLGARADTLAAAEHVLLAEHPRLRLVGSHHGYFADAESRRVAEQIRSAAPDLLFVAMSSPRKEYWLDEQASGLGVPLSMGVGGAVDVLAGTIRRAPTIMQRAGLEWLFRLAQEPRRLFKRYAVTNSTFVILLVRELASRRFSREIA